MAQAVRHCGKKEERQDGALLGHGRENPGGKYTVNLILWYCHSAERLFATKNLCSK
jgi:hypothetical protein